jgi:hypothetical protein
LRLLFTVVNSIAANRGRGVSDNDAEIGREREREKWLAKDRQKADREQYTYFPKSFPGS